MAKTLEEIAKQLKKMKFKSALVGGVDKKDVWKKIERLNDDYMQYIEQQRIGYEAVLAEKDRMIAGGITVNAAQILPGPGAMPPMDPGMMGLAPFGGAAMAQFGDPSSTASGSPVPQGEGLNGFGSGAPSSQGEGMYGGPAMPPMPPAMMGLPPMLDENGNPLPMPPMDQNMMPAQHQPSPWGEGAPTGADEGSYAGMPPMPPAMMGLPPMLDENGNPVPMDPTMMGMPPFGDPSSTASGPPSPQGEGLNRYGSGAPSSQGEGIYGGAAMPPFDPAMMGMAMPMPGADYAPPQDFDPTMMPMPGADYAPPAGGFEPDWGTPAPADSTVRPLQGELGPQGPEGVYPPPADLAYAHPVDMHPHGDPAMAQFGDPPMTPPGPQMPPFNPGPVPGGMPVSPERVG